MTSPPPSGTPELRAHIDLLTSQNVASGMPAEEAVRAARMESGVEPVKEQVRDVGAGALVGALHVVDPRKTRLKAGYAAKTDRLDARRLADALRRASVVGIYYPPRRFAICASCAATGATSPGCRPG